MRAATTASVQRSASVGTQRHDERVRIGFAAATGAAAARDFAQRGVGPSADRLRANRDQRDREQVREAIAEVSFYSSGAFGTVRQVLLSYRREKPRCLVTDAMRTAGSALGLASLRAHSGVFEEPGLRRCVCLRRDVHPFAYHRSSRAQDSRRLRADGAMGWNDKLLVQHRVDKQLQQERCR